MERVGAARRSRPVRLFLLLLGSLLLLYGAVGLTFDLHLPQRVVQGAALWRALVETGHWPPPVGEQAVGQELSPWLVGVAKHLDRVVLRVWLAWGLGVLLLLWGSGRPVGLAVLPRRRFTWADLIALLGLGGMVAAACLLRARWLFPLADGSVPVSHYDEMVYLEAALLWRRGLHPYVDFFLAHPPGILYAFWPATLAGGAWGGPAVLLAGRWWQFFWGVLTVVLLYLVGREIAGRRGGLAAALVLALEVQAAYVAPLETVVNLGTVLALLLYLAGLKARRRWVRFFCMALAGGAGAFCGLTKAPGVVVLLLLGLLALLAGRPRDLLAGAIGAAGTALLLAGPLAGRAPLAFLRQVVGFQLLRPQETLYGRNHLARMADYPDSRLTFLLLSGAVLLLSGLFLADVWGRLGVRRARRAPLPMCIAPGFSPGRTWLFPLTLGTVVPLLFLFSYGRAYHSRYYVQLVVPFALLVAVAVGETGALLRSWSLHRRGVAAALLLALLLFSWPHLLHRRQVAAMVRYDGTYGPVGQALAETLPEEGVVLALDPGYPLLAGRPPASLPDGTYLVDGAGLMVYHALGITGMSPRQILERAAQTSHEINPLATFHRPAAQDLIVSALYRAGAAVIDPRIAAEDLTPQTQEFLRTRGREVIWAQYTAAFAVERTALLGRSRAGLALWDLNMRPLTPQGEGPAAPPGEALALSPGETLQVSLYWLVEERPAVPLKVSLELEDAAGRVVARLWEPPHFGEPTTDLWPAGWVYQDHHNLPLSPDLPAGEYRLVVRLLDAASNAPQGWAGKETVEEGLVVGMVELLR